jgi:hypothetical protein
VPQFLVFNQATHELFARCEAGKANSLFQAQNSLFRPKIFPVPLRREFDKKELVDQCITPRTKAGFSRDSQNFPVLGSKHT